jgi:cobalamin biosynthesis Mg chelatase CobN
MEDDLAAIDGIEPVADAGGRREQAAALRRLKVMLVTPRQDVLLSVSGSLGQRDMALAKCRRIHQAALACTALPMPSIARAF